MEEKATAGEVVLVRGWALLDGAPADRITAYVGDQPPLHLSGAQPRPDVAALAGDAAPAAIAAGFAGLITIPEHLDDGWLPIRVRASLADGRTWTSHDVIVRVKARVEAPVALDPAARIADDRAADTGEAEADGGLRPLRVCVFTHALTYGGGELYLQELLLRLRRDHGMEILVVSPIDGPLKRELLDAGIEVHVTHDYVMDRARYLSRVLELSLIIRAWNADVVLGNTLGVVPAIDAGLLCELPTIWAIHESFELKVFANLAWGKARLETELEERWRRCLSGAHTIFEAESTLALFASEVPTLRGRCVEYGIDTANVSQYLRNHQRRDVRARLGLRNEQTALLCMGTFQERKAQLALLVAFARVAPRFPEATLIMVGDQPTPYSRTVHEAVESLGLEGRVRLIPVDPDTYRWYRAADILVSASNVESLPRSMLEAMAFGLPVLATDVYGVAEVVQDGRNGWLCQPFDLAALSAGLHRALCSTPAERASMSEACLSDSAGFDGAHYASSYAELMGSLATPNRLKETPPAAPGGFDG